MYVNRAEDDKIRRKRVELQEEQALHMGGDVADDFEYATGTSAATGVMAKYDDRTKQAHKLKIGSSGGLSAKDQSHLSGADIAALAQRMGKAPNAKMDTNFIYILRTGRCGGVYASSAAFETQNEFALSASGIFHRIPSSHFRSDKVPRAPPLRYCSKRASSSFVSGTPMGS